MRKPTIEYENISPEMQKLRDEQKAAQIAWRLRLAISDPAERKALEAQKTQEMAEWQEKTGVTFFLNLGGVLDYVKKHKKSQG
ncbi:hypothetical protein EN794_051225 [Mesorhizobium sp. M00.F.Ca.ET.151.01.1.1]|uniref:hypothetical protein n=1 Tax=unclassified Mesorhizobium TaxID=325217 RepID=UPI000FD530B1|nr:MULTISPECIES: hypothetical protein [unclassified Mesorhizobium]RVD55725.1 hypothetical protein EN746_05570 [Mesorhizobium sp. M8A.F.Ca.ET.023.02.2.1]TGR37715.1 hypothetical protein EN842_48835 [bacterium M00.F.Ca.ET.199.01.1.1]TGU22697.1 hypothetical protein EN799_51390 [bacterium M00.F.Ca.ET.156.01.1.1]TGU87388.1 hypothetical protein EN794_051225 [Mesorhizobium sp. M00.F.Ca.ET.151.01.1.1]TGV82907.1 hypothetical protein EN792_028230 [Mesorhizobium sp. M00.F.Ca.ET.149.01.1.1]